MTQMTLDPKKATKEDILKGLELLAKAEDRKERIKRGEIKGGQTWGELSPKAKAKRLEAGRRLRVKQKLLCLKAIEAGITITDNELTEEIARLDAAAV